MTASSQETYTSTGAFWRNQVRSQRDTLSLSPLTSGTTVQIRCCHSVKMLNKDAQLRTRTCTCHCQPRSRYPRLSLAYIRKKVTPEEVGPDK